MTENWRLHLRRSETRHHKSRWTPIVKKGFTPSRQPMRRSILSLILGASLLGCGQDSGNFEISGRGLEASQSGAERIVPEQRIGRLSINYPYQFNLSEQEAAAMSRGVPSDAQEALLSLVSYTSSPTCGLREVRLVVAQFVPGHPMSIEAAVTDTSYRLSHLKGVSNPEISVTSSNIAGHPARRISYQADRWGGVIAADVLIIVDSHSSTAWQLQFLSAAKSGGRLHVNQKPRLRDKNN